MKGKRDSKASKHYEKQEEEVDRISQLPDSLIHEILSFIDMRYAVQTCVLSKRWINVWRSLPFITSDCALFFDPERYDLADEVTLNRLMERYVGFVDNVFKVRDESDIQVINLDLIMFNYASVLALNRWIQAAVYHNVQNLDIIAGYFLNIAYKIPRQLLNCESLKSLSIKLVGAPHGSYVDLILPESLSLSQIKRLELNGISISNIELQRLISSCPLLEMITIQNCDIQMRNQRNTIIDSYSLRKFELIDNRHTYLGSTDNLLSCTSKICAPNLEAFRCTGFMTEYFSLENLSSVVFAKLKMRLQEEEADETAKTYSELPAEEKEVFAKRMMKYLGAVHNVQYLTLSAGFLEVLLQAPGTLYRQPTQLCNLKTMKLEMRFTKGCLRSIACLLMISPIIRTLILESKESNLADIRDDWEAEFSTCKISHLEFVVIREVEACDNELKFLRFLLKKSMALKKLILIFQSTSDSLDREHIRRFKKNLRALPTASSGVRIYYFSSEDHTASLLEQHLELLN